MKTIKEEKLMKKADNKIKQGLKDIKKGKITTLEAYAKKRRINISEITQKLVLVLVKLDSGTFQRFTNNLIFR